MRLPNTMVLLLSVITGCAGQEFASLEEASDLGAAGAGGSAQMEAGPAAGSGGTNVSSGGNSSGGAASATGGATSAGGMAGSVGAMGGAAPGEGGAFADAAATDSSKPDVCVATGVERCFDGIDNDCNGLGDCADPACAVAATCVPDPAPLDVAVRVAAGAACPAGFEAPVDLSSGLEPGAGCTACGCTAGALTCQAEIAALATNSGGPSACDATVTSKVVRDVDGCTFIANALGIGNLTGVKAAVPCTPGTNAVLPASWATATRLCKTNAVGTGCNAGFVCAPAVPAPAVAERCAVATGTKACPAGYASRGAFYARYDDTRACSCTCEASGDCTGTSVVQHQDSCAAAGTVLTTGTRTCTGGKHDWYVTVTGTPAGNPTCTGKTKLTGTVTPAEPHTVCCY
jgi:hypothetical protein